MRVVELSDKEEAAAFCAKLFRRWGADVTKVEPPARPEPARHLDIYLNSGKRRLPLDLKAAPDALRGAVAGADVIVTDYSARELDELELLKTAPAPVVVSITPFGLSGPYRDYQATAATLLALGGYTFLMGDPGRAPLTMPGSYVYYQAGTYAYNAALAAHLAIGRNGPTTIEVSMLECLASLHQFTDTMWKSGGMVRSRHGNRWENLCPTTLLPCKDGWYGVNIMQNFWFPFAQMIGHDEIAAEGDLSGNFGRMDHQDEVEDMVMKALWDKGRKEIFKEGQEVWRVPVGYSATMHDLLEDPHLTDRSFLRPVTIETAGTVLTPGSPFRLVDEGIPDEPSPGDVPAAQPAAPPVVLRVPQDERRDSTPSGSSVLGGKPARPLEGVRILDLTRIWSGPLATRILGDLGAEIIKIEAQEGRGGGGPAGVPTRRGMEASQEPAPGHPWNRQPLFNKLNRNKKSIAIDLKSQKGRQIFLDLVELSDVVIENFSARAMPGLGLSYEEMSAVNDQIIYVAMQAFGRFGAYRDYVGLGPSIEPTTGMTALMGYSDDEPRVTSKALTDAIAGNTAASAVITALQRRRARGKGCLIDLSQHETGITYVGEFVVEAQLTGKEPSRIGNAHRDFAPHGIYRCAGDDAWIAVAARNEVEWASLCDVLALTHLIKDPRFALLEARHANRAALDAEIEGTTVTRDKRDLERALQARGVPVGAVLSAPEYLSDPHLEERGYFAELNHKEVGPTSWDGSPLKFNGDRGYSGFVPAPLLGEDNRSLLHELLGLSTTDLDALYAEGVLAESPPIRGA